MSDKGEIPGYTFTRLDDFDVEERLRERFPDVSDATFRRLVLDILTRILEAMNGEGRSEKEAG